MYAGHANNKLYSGQNPTVEVDNDKNTVIALREIAEETLSTEQLKNDLIEEYQTNTFSEDEEISELEDNSDDNQTETNELDFDQVQQSNTVFVKSGTLIQSAQIQFLLYTHVHWTTSKKQKRHTHLVFKFYLQTR